MKKILLLSTLGLSSMLSLIAGDTNSCDTACEPCVCCDCEGPGVDIMALTPPAGPNVGECSGFIISADFLYWFSKETNLPYAIGYETKETTLGGSFDIFASKAHQLDSEWAPGFRVGLGMNSDCDAWSILAEYTWYQAHKSSSTSVDPFAATAQVNVNGTRSLTSPWISGDAKSADISTFFSHVSADWDFHFNQIDLDLGRHFWLSKCTTVRPFVGLRAGWTHTDFNIKGTRTNLNEVTTAKIHQDYWGVGPMIGTRSTYQFTECFALYGGGEVALLYGERNMTKKGFASHPDQPVSWTYKDDNCSAPQAVVDLEIGLSYTSCWCDDQSRLRIDLGWEFHDWFNHTSRPIVDIDNTDPGIVSNIHTTDLIMSGLILKARYDF